MVQIQGEGGVKIFRPMEMLSVRQKLPNILRMKEIVNFATL